MRPLSKAECADQLAVSRETADRLQAYLDLLTLWQARINLVAASTLADPWRRHILDSGQLFGLAPSEAKVWVDLGSGAGLPGMVLAIMGAPEMHLVESDLKKAAFLREAARVTGTSVQVHAVRIEQAKLPPPDVVTARALAPLDKLLDLASRHLVPGTICLFAKGETAPAELTDASRHWHMKHDVISSLSDPRGQVLRLREVVRVDRG